LDDPSRAHTRLGEQPEPAVADHRHRIHSECRRLAAAEIDVLAVDRDPMRASRQRDVGRDPRRRNAGLTGDQVVGTRRTSERGDHDERPSHVDLDARPGRTVASQFDVSAA